MIVIDANLHIALKDIAPELKENEFNEFKMAWYLTFGNILPIETSCKCCPIYEKQECEGNWNPIDCILSNVDDKSEKNKKFFKHISNLKK